MISKDDTTSVKNISAEYYTKNPRPSLPPKSKLTRELRELMQDLIDINLDSEVSHLQDRGEDELSDVIKNIEKAKSVADEFRSKGYDDRWYWSKANDVGRISILMDDFLRNQQSKLYGNYEDICSKLDAAEKNEEDEEKIAELLKRRGSIVESYRQVIKEADRRGVMTSKGETFRRGIAWMDGLYKNLRTIAMRYSRINLSGDWKKEFHSVVQELKAVDPRWNFDIDNIFMGDHGRFQKAVENLFDDVKYVASRRRNVNKTKNRIQRDISIIGKHLVQLNAVNPNSISETAWKRIRGILDRTEPDKYDHKQKIIYLAPTISAYQEASDAILGKMRSLIKEEDNFHAYVVLLGLSDDKNVENGQSGRPNSLLKELKKKTIDHILRTTRTIGSHLNKIEGPTAAINEKLNRYKLDVRELRKYSVKLGQDQVVAKLNRLEEKIDRMNRYYVVPGKGIYTDEPKISPERDNTESGDRTRYFDPDSNDDDKKYILTGHPAEKLTKACECDAMESSHNECDLIECDVIEYDVIDGEAEKSSGPLVYHEQDFNTRQDLYNYATKQSELLSGPISDFLVAVCPSISGTFDGRSLAERLMNAEKLIPDSLPEAHDIVYQNIKRGVEQLSI